MHVIDPPLARELEDAGCILLPKLGMTDLRLFYSALDLFILPSLSTPGWREQFGRVIGSFQAVKHMCAEMAARHEPCRALVWYAAHAFDAVPEEAALIACHAKSHTGEVHRFVARTSTEVHGGMGFTDLLGLHSLNGRIIDRGVAQGDTPGFTDLLGLHYWFKRIGFDRLVLGGPEKVRSDAAQLQGWVTAAA